VKPAFILGAVLVLTAIPILLPQGADNGKKPLCWETHEGCWIFARLKFIDVLVNQECAMTSIGSAREDRKSPSFDRIEQIPSLMAVLDRRQ
jgi:hypothetical protein